MMPELNDFQALMQGWTSLGPYNALDLIRLPGRADAARWREAIVQPVTEMGFQPPREIEAIYDEYIAGITAELNKPFVAGDAPMRFFLVNEPGGTHYFGVVFDHWFADSPSYRFFTRRAFENYKTPGAVSRLPALQFCRKPFATLFGKSHLHVVAGESIRAYCRHLHAYRIPIPDPMDFTSGFQHLQFPVGLIETIRGFGKKSGATVNDVFLAAALQTMGEFTAPDRSTKRSRIFRPKRDRIAFTTAVDIRPLASELLEDQIGCFISYYSMVAQNPEKMPLEKLTAQVAAYTRDVKSNRKALRFFQTFKPARMFWNYYKKPSQRALMMHRATPFLGGISNVNLTDSWIGRDDRLLDYIRVSPTGPLVPTVFTLSTIRDRLALSLTHRSAIFTREQAIAIATGFALRLKTL